MVPSACSDECARGAEGEAKAACAISKPRPGPRSTLAQAHAPHRYTSQKEISACLCGASWPSSHPMTGSMRPMTGSMRPMTGSMRSMTGSRRSMHTPGARRAAS